MPPRKRTRTSTGADVADVKAEATEVTSPTRASKRVRQSTTEVKIEEPATSQVETTKKKTSPRRTRPATTTLRAKSDQVEANDLPSVKVDPTTPQKKRKTSKKTVTTESQAEAASEADATAAQSPDKPKKSRAKPKAKAEPEEPLKMRNASARMFVGAHVSMAKSIANAVTNANHIGANAFAMFLKNQRKWTSPQYNDEDVVDFRKRMLEMGYDGKTQVLPHGSYLINLANDDREKRDQGYDCFLDDLRRCEQLGVMRYNFHPGSTASCSREKGISNLAECINKAIAATKEVKVVVENMAGHGHIIGGPLEELASVFDQVHNKGRIGFCLDTCHLFAAGHDIRTQEKYEALMDKFDSLIGLQYLSGWHLNDSKADLGANKDLHQNIGLGYLGLEPFRCIMNDKRLEGMPLILETPTDDSSGQEDKSVWAKEIELLEWLVGKTSDDPEVLAKAKKLFAKGAGDREKALAAANRKTEKQEKDAAKAQKAATANKGKRQTKLPGAS